MCRLRNCANIRYHHTVYQRLAFLPLLQRRSMKRKAGNSPEPSLRKTAKVVDYCNVEQKRDAHGQCIWPAPEVQMNAAREFLKDWFVRPSLYIFSDVR